MFESGNPQRLAGDHHLLRSLHENYLSFLSGKDECGDDERWGWPWEVVGDYWVVLDVHIYLALVAFRCRLRMIYTQRIEALQAEIERLGGQQEERADAGRREQHFLKMSLTGIEKLIP